MNILNRRISTMWLIGILAVSSLLGASIGIAAIVHSHTINNNVGTVSPQQPVYTIAINGVTQSNDPNVQLTINWGNIVVGTTYTATLNVNNTGPLPISISLITPTITGLTYTFDTNNTALPLNTGTTGIIALSVDSTYVKTTSSSFQVHLIVSTT